MSTFELAIPTVLKHEGGYVNDPADPGGQTKYGISMRWLVANNLIDVVANEEGVTHDMVIRAMSVGEADKLYKQYWWDAFGYGRIDNQDVATKLFDTAVNIGNRPAVRLLQRCTGCAVIDGLLGPQTIDVTNKYSLTANLLTCYRNRQANFYHDLVLDHPALTKFLNGWMERAIS
jgi:lysozyme family protein